MADKRWTDLDAEVAEHDRSVEEAGGAANVSRQKRMGRLTARERIAGLVDDGSFVELGRHALHRHAASSERLAENRVPGDGVVCGFGNVAGRAIAVYAHDPTTLRGALGHEASKKIRRLLDLAWERKLPVVCFADCDGVRVDEGIDAIEAYGEILRQTVRQETESLQITLVCGLCVGAAAYAAALTDLVGMVAEQSMMFITGPKVTKAVTGEETTLEDLGGAEVHATKTGQCHALVKDESEGIAWIKSVLAMLEVERPTTDPVDRDTRAIESIVPSDAPRRAYDVKKLLDVVVDEKSLVELSPSFAKNLVTAFARLGGRTVALVASQPMVHAGCLDVDASRKGAHFIRLASKLGFPIVTFVDVPGFLPGTKQEHGGILREGAELLSAYGSARVPLVCVVVRKSYGGASVLSFAADTRLALPSAHVGPVGAEVTAEIVEGAPAIDDSVWSAASAGYVDRVLRPEHVRRDLVATLRTLVGTKLVRG